MCPQAHRLQRILKLRTERSCRWTTESMLPRRLLVSGLRSQSCVTWSLFTSQSPPNTTIEGWLWATACHSLFFLSSVPSSHLDPVGIHSTLQGSGAATPEHPSVIDPLMEQDEGPGTPPAKQSTPSSRSVTACQEPSISAPRLSGAARRVIFASRGHPLRDVGPSAALHCRWHTSLSGFGVGSTPVLFSSLSPALSFFSSFSTDSFLALLCFFFSSFSHFTCSQILNPTVLTHPGWGSGHPQQCCPQGAPGLRVDQ